MNHDLDYDDRDEFDGDDEFRAVIEGQRTHVETRGVVGDLDAEWFDEHPQHHRRIRRYVPGEFDNESGGAIAGLAGDEWVVLVQRGGLKALFPIGSFNERGWKAGGLR
jgi:hypothetical protein